MLGIIGGTGIYDPKSVKEIAVKEVETPYGDAPKVKIVEFDGKRIAFLPRHGKSHAIPPHMVNYRANIYALKQVGVDGIISTNSVGCINESLSPGDVVIPHDFLDFTKDRQSTFYDDMVVHIDMSNPYCPEIRKALIEAAGAVSNVSSRGVYACTQGPRFETPSEIRMLKTLGGDVVGMTGVPEVVLSREKEICYGSVCIVVNPAAGISEEKLTSTELMEIVRANEAKLREIVTGAIASIPEQRKCDCGQTLEGAVV
ncbi:MAG: S-methyl-5'-thioadenosine phosphorylase [Candidatus Hydrothermarchaeaceae archaeon]